MKDVLFTSNTAYDEPKPIASIVLRSAFHRTSENMMNLTFVMDPGTDHEVTKTLTLPKNIDIDICDNGHSFVMFDDAECTIVTHWDRMSDHTWYIFTDPSGDLVDKYTALGMALKRERENAE